MHPSDQTIRTMSTDELERYRASLVGLTGDAVDARRTLIDERLELDTLVALLRSNPTRPMDALTQQQRERYHVLRDRFDDDETRAANARATRSFGGIA